MVQLKATEGDATEALEEGFQFQYGSIKSSSYNPEYDGFGNFNSDMVQLKVYSSTTTTSEFSLFQFQYGSIKSFSN